MTATSVIMQADAVVMIADTAGADLAGNFAGHASKVVTLPHVNAAFMLRGHVAALPAIFDALSRSNSLNEMFLAPADLMRRLVEHFRVAAGPDNALCSPWDLVIAGVDEIGPRAAAICNHNLHPGIPAFTAVPIEHAIITPGVDPDLAQEVYEAPEASAAALLAEQRRTDRNAAGHCLIGGRGIVTRIDRAGITQRIIGEWADVIGKPIDPAAEWRAA